MGTMVAGSPLLGFGPPGWVAYAVLGVGTAVGLGIIYMSRPKSKAKTKPAERAEPITKPCRMWTVRTHAQGTDMGGTTGSTLGAPPIVLNIPISAALGAANAAATYALLTRRQAEVRTDVYAQALKWLAQRPFNGGFLGQKSFPVLGMAGGIRFDIDSYGCSPNFIY